MTDLNDPRLFIDRELSVLQFFSRVLEEAQDATNPLLERVLFLSIVSSNLAEFFMVRVAGLKQQIEAGVAEYSPTGSSPAQQLEAVRVRSQELMQETRKCLKAIGSRRQTSRRNHARHHWRSCTHRHRLGPRWLHIPR